MLEYPKIKLQFPTFLVCLLLIHITVSVYWGVQNYNFIHLDDTAAIVENPHVTYGITIKSIRWAFTTNYCYGYRMPLTRLSFILDNQLYGLNSGAFHITNLIFQLLNVILLFLLLMRLTGLLWQSAFVACLFAIYPIHVESVAWVSG